MEKRAFRRSLLVLVNRLVSCPREERSRGRKEKVLRLTGHSEELHAENRKLIRLAAG